MVHKIMVRKRSPQKRERYLQAALELFVSKGVMNTSTSAIAKKAGTAAGTLFLYFPTKQDLIHALVLKIGLEQSESVKARLDPSLSIKETFFIIWESSLAWFQENYLAYQYIRQVRDSGIIAAEVVAESEQFFDYYFQAIQRGLEEDQIKAYPLELIGSLLYHNIVAVMDLVGSNPDPAIRTAYHQAGFNIFWDGIKTK
jgi:AcrR family transcriptional regulator